MAHVERFLLEMGEGFAVVGRQRHLEVGGQDFYIDLLLYQLVLRCYVVVELKVGEFKPEYSGKMNFYLARMRPKKAPSPSLKTWWARSINQTSLSLWAGAPRSGSAESS
jgi:hypothetical protein